MHAALYESQGKPWPRPSCLTNTGYQKPSSLFFGGLCGICADLTSRASFYFWPWIFSLFTSRQIPEAMKGEWFHTQWTQHSVFIVEVNFVRDGMNFKIPFWRTFFTHMLVGCVWDSQGPHTEWLSKLVAGNFEDWGHTWELRI